MISPHLQQPPHLAQKHLLEAFLQIDKQADILGW